ncbi:MAG: Mpv17/PMP22 family protein [Bacteroidales bacterium]
MNKKDILFIIVLLALLLLAIIPEAPVAFYLSATKQYPMLMAFAKFFILAPLGEVIGLRIKTGYYHQPGFGLFPKAVVWGLLGLTIQLALVVFSAGTPAFMNILGVSNAQDAIMTDGFLWDKLFVAFGISVAMNLIYAPVLMTLHRITDIHIEHHNGLMTSLVSPLDMGRILQELNWRVQWHFVFKKTIPLFWIPAHTITFMLPAQHRVLFAAFLGIMLGVFLAVASVLGRRLRSE